MQRVGLVKQNDLTSASKCFRRVEEGLRLEGLPPLPFASLEELKDTTLYCLKEGARVIALAAITSETGLSNNTLYEAGYQGERVCLISLLAIDPAFERKGIARVFLRDLLSFYRETTFFAYLNPRNPRALHFFQKAGFILLEPARSLYGKAYQKTGLCREGKW